MINAGMGIHMAYTADLESLVRGAPRAWEIHLIREIREIRENREGVAQRLWALYNFLYPYE